MIYSRQPTSLVISRHYCLKFVLECELKTREQVRSFTFILPMLRIFRNPSFNLWQINSPRFLSVSFALCAGKILIEFSRIVCVSLFSYQGSLFCRLATAHLDYHIHQCLSSTFLFSFRSFMMFACRSQATCLLYHIFVSLSTPFFTFFKTFEIVQVVYSEETILRDSSVRIPL